MSQRYFYLSAFSDEVVPCDPTLDGWADWLSSPHENWGNPTGAAEGNSFAGSALLMLPDIVATCRDGEWTLSRSIDGDFVAVRWGEGEGWGADDIVAPTESFLLEHLASFAPDDSSVFVAVGKHEDGWRFTYRAGPPPKLEAERVQ